MAIKIEGSPTTVFQQIESISNALSSAAVPEQSALEQLVQQMNPEPRTDGDSMKSMSSLIGNLQAQKLLAEVPADPVSYTVGPSYNDVRAGKAEMHRGHASGSVFILQEKLTRAGFPAKADSFFGPKTENAVKEFQRAHGLPDTGKVDQKTLQELDKAAGPAPNPQPLPKPNPQTDPSSGPVNNPKINPDLELPDDPYLKMAKMYDIASNRLEKGYKKGQDPVFDKVVENWLQVPPGFSDLDSPEYAKMAESHSRFTAAAHKAGF